LEWSRSNRIGLRSGEGINYQNTSVTIKRAVEVRARPPFARKEAKDGAPSSCGLGKGAPPAVLSGAYEAWACSAILGAY